MRFAWFWVLMLLFPIAGWALSPAEPPPGDFPGRQYIDSTGCVFRQNGDGRWDARLGRDGKPVCGYPPSLSIRGLGGRPKLQALDPDAGKSRAELLHETLARTVLGDLREGELASDPKPLQELPDMGPEPASSAPLDALRASLKAAPAVRQAMAVELQPNLRLCRLLGHDTRSAPNSEARDPTQGYCDSLSRTGLSRLAFVRPVTSGRHAAPVPAAPRKAGAAMPAHSEIDAHGASARRSVLPAAPRPTAPPAPRPATRHVQVGQFADPAQGDAIVQKVSGLGYPLHRGRLAGAGSGWQVILAGPFRDRQEISRALERIRHAGFKDAFVR